jgi:Nuclear transport factor 2 (NTF2) domain
MNRKERPIRASHTGLLFACVGQQKRNLVHCVADLRAVGSHLDAVVNPPGARSAPHARPPPRVPLLLPNMGAKPASAAIRPQTVADGFTSVYYRLAAKQPAQLAQLYGDDSEVSHAPGEALVGLPAIAAAARGLPLANKPAAAVAAVDAMSTGAGGYVVVVSGALEGAAFTQTFVLCPAEGDKVGHFYCRNDIFRFAGATGEVAVEAEEAAARPADVLVAQRAEPVQVAAAAPGSEEVGKTVKATGSPAAVTDVSVGNGHDAASEEESDGYDSEEESEGDEVSESEEDTVAPATAADASSTGVATSGVGGGSGNVTAAESETGSSPEASAAPRATTAAAAASPAAAPVAKSIATEESTESKDAPSAKLSKKTDAPAAAAAPAMPAAPAKPKTWASIVSTAGTITPPAATAAVASPAAASSGAPAATAAVSATAVPKQAETGGSKPADAGATSSSYDGPSKGPSSYSSGHHQNYQSHQHNNSNNDNSGGGGWSSVDNKRHSSHHGHEGGYQKVMANGHHTAGFKHNQGRVYGPSAVIQLNTLPMDRSKDWRTLQQEFLAEFNSYGFPVRNVEVKTHKGLAFIEYADVSGVRAAVAAWADGPRDEGSFKGIPLSVTEKRQRRPHIPGEGGPHIGRGGRGGMRGGRGGGRGRGRGMPYSSGSSGAPPQAPGAQASATSTF